MRKLCKSKTLRVCLIAFVVLALMAVSVFAEGEGEEYVSMFYGTFWSLVPPLVAIILALITKEVYLSLFVGILMGGLLYANFNPWQAVLSITEGFTASIADGWNAGILIFLVVLGIMVALMNKAGGSAAYGRWAAEHIKSQRGSLIATMILGVLIFVDDYFNCLTVGSVMQPVTDKFKVSRAKLSYVIDATAAPVCIIAPISSWAAAVTGSVVEQLDTAGNVIPVDGFRVFLQTIPYNFYALLTLTFMICLFVMKFDYGPMKRAQRITDDTGDLLSGTTDEYANVAKVEVSQRGKVIDLIIPVLVLIALCILGMVYTGGIFDGEDFITAFSNADASVGLALGSIISIVFAFLYFIIRRVVTLKEFAECIPEGFRQMVPAILILVFAWTLAGFCRGNLGASDFVGPLMKNSAGALMAILPAIMFLVACFVAFSTGTSWGTFAILIPIAQSVFPGEVGTPLILTIAACMAGSVFGDHCSPISDTTIMASAGARVNHLLHVSTQAPYAITVAVICFICYLLAGFIQNWLIVLPIGIVLTILTTFVIKKFVGGKSAA